MIPLGAQGYVNLLESALSNSNQNHVGRSLPACFSISEPHVLGLFLGVHPSERVPNGNTWSYATVYQHQLGYKPGPWDEMAILHTQVIVALLYARPDPTATLVPSSNEGNSITACAKQSELVNALYKYLVSEQKPTGWLVPLLHQVCNDLRLLAIAADEKYVEKNEKPRALEEASRLLQKCFSACLNDRVGNAKESKKRGTWYMATLLFKTYFKLKSSHLCKSIVRGINAAVLTGFQEISKSHQTTYTYYLGLLAFLREDYTEAETYFTNALAMVHSKAIKNIERILSYLIPIMLLRGVLPTPRNLKKAGRLENVYRPFIDAYKTGNVETYDRHLLYTEKRLMERGTYLVVERAREGVVRNLIKRAWILEGKPPRMSVAVLRGYMIAGSADESVDSDEMECILANLIGKGFMKGYISHSHGMVVLSKDRPFPWAAPYRPLSAMEKAERDQRELENAKRMPLGSTN